jgi:hypothetical protein
MIAHPRIIIPAHGNFKSPQAGRLAGAPWLFYNGGPVAP